MANAANSMYGSRRPKRLRVSGVDGPEISRLRPRVAARRDGRGAGGARPLTVPEKAADRGQVRSKIEARRCRS